MSDPHTLTATDPTRPPGGDFDPGAIVAGRYVVYRELAAGGQGVVYVAWDRWLNREVALKTLRVWPSDIPDASARFLREAQITGQLEHPGIPPVHDAGTVANGRPFLAMKLVHGRTLAELLRERASPADDLPRYAGIFEQICQTVAFAHVKKFIHRDLKPSNVMVGDFGEVLVMDWGLAKAAGPQGDGSDLTIPGQVMGTVGYMPPEQARGEIDRLDARSDVFALGGILCFILTGRPPSPGTPGGSAPVGSVEVPPDTLTRLETCGAEPELVALARRCLAPNRDDRPADAKAVAAAVAAYRAGVEQRLRKAEADRAAAEARAAEQRKRRRVKLMLAGAVALVVGLLAFGLWWRDRREVEHRGEVARVEAERRTAEAQTEKRTRLLQVADRRSPVRHAGWSAADLALVREAANIRPGPDARDAAAATLIGLDGLPAWTKDTTTPEGSGFSAVAFSPDGKYLLAGSYEKHPAWLVDLATRQITVSPHAGTGPIGFRPDGTPIQVVPPAADRPDFLLWDVAGNRAVGTVAVRPGPDEQVGSVALSARAGRLAVAVVGASNSSAGWVAVRDAATGELVRKVDKPASQVALSPDGTMLAVGNREGRVECWPLPAGDPIPVPVAGSTAIDALAFHPRGPRGEAGRTSWLLAIGDNGGRVVVWDVAGMRLVSCTDGMPDGVNALAFSPDGSVVAAVSRGPVRVCDVATGRPLLHAGERNYATGVAFSADGHLASCSINLFGSRAAIDLWRLENGRGVRTLLGLTGHVIRVRRSPDGQWLAALSDEWRVGVWEWKTGRLAHVLEAPKGYTADNAALAFGRGPRSARLLVATGTAAKQWDLTDGRETGHWKLPPGATDQVAIRPDGRAFLFRMEMPDGKRVPFATGQPRVVQVRELLPGGRLATVRTITDFFFTTMGQVTTDDQFVIFGGYDDDAVVKRRSVRVYDAATSERVWDTGDIGHSTFEVDATGRRLLHPTPRAGRLQLVDLASRRTEEWELPGLVTLGLGGSIYATKVPPPGGSGTPVRFFRFGSAEPFLVVRLAVETASNAEFTPDGRQFFWGNVDGTVMICDLDEVGSRTAPFAARD